MSDDPCSFDSPSFLLRDKKGQTVDAVCEVSLLLLESIRESFETFVHVTCSLSVRLRLAHLDKLDVLIEANFFFSKNMDEVPDVGMLLINAMSEPIVPT